MFPSLGTLPKDSKGLKEDSSSHVVFPYFPIKEDSSIERAGSLCFSGSNAGEAPARQQRRVRWEPQLTGSAYWTSDVGFG